MIEASAGIYDVPGRAVQPHRRLLVGRHAIDIALDSPLTRR